MKYIIILDEKFFDLGKAELDNISKEDNSFKKLTNRFFLLESGMNIPRSKKFSFIEGLIPVEELNFDFDDYEKIINALKKQINKNKSFKLEVINLNIHNKNSAKDIEVKIGTALEKEGYNVDLKNPNFYVYIFLSKLGVFIGSLSSENAINANQFRFSKKSIISRAQFKLEEAIKFFNVNNPKVVLDIGAAPGGWSLVMLSKNSKVIALDNALLNYKALLNSTSKNFIIFSDSESYFDNYTKSHAKIFPIETIYNSYDFSSLNFDLCHIKKNIENIDIKKLNIKVDLLLIDMNIKPEKSAEEACKLSSLLNKEGILLMTIKLIDERITKYIVNVKNILLDCYDDIEIKKLPHNRKEIMLFARVKNKI
ncbi:MAG: SAM-dependent methyltransferase [Candidatus Micrarchaeia archaeon]